MNLRVAHAGSRIADGDTFDLSNGIDRLTFEFDRFGSVTPGHIEVDVNVSDTPADVAQAIRNAINSATANAVLQLVATTASGKTRDTTRLNDQRGIERDTYLDSDPVIAVYGFAASDNLGSLNFGSHIDAILSGTDDVRGEDHGDRNRHRDQGQLIIESNTISLAAEYGIRVTTGDITADGSGVNRNRPGGVQNFGTLNSLEQVPSVVIQNNLLINNGSGNTTGISLDGSSDSSVPNPPSPFARVINNTVAGWGTGIEVVDGASPTLLNNVIADSSTTSIRYSQAGQTIVRGTVFAGNADNPAGSPGVGTEARFAQTSELFVNPTVETIDLAAGSPNFYLADGSAVIDSSIESQNDRTLLVSVKNSVGIPPSPIIAPDLDLVGQLRVDDPNVNSSTGQGQQIFKDRGGIDRADTEGPQAQLLVPLDNDTSGVDVDSDTTFLQLSDGVYESFEILVSEGSGIGPDQSTITPEQVVLTENGRVLNEGLDYIFGYNSNSCTLRLTPLSGIWRPDSVYEILLTNSPVTTDDGATIRPISDLAGNPLAANRSTGETRFTILMPEVQLDFGDAPNSYLTGFGSNGPRHAIVNQHTPRLGDLVDGEDDGLPSDDNLATVVADGNVNAADDGPFSIDTVNGLTITLNSVPESGDNLGLAVGGNLTVFEFISAADFASGNAIAANRVAVEFAAAESVESVASSLAAVIAATFETNNEAAVAKNDSATPDTIVIQGLDDEDGVPVGSFVGTTTTDGLFLDVAAGQVGASGQLQTSDPGNVIAFLNEEDAAGTVIPIPVVGDGVLDAWIDFDANGQFDADEKVIDGVSVSEGVSELRVFTPTDAALGLTWARFRISTDGSDGPNLLATNGEVEDLQVRVVSVVQPDVRDDAFSVDEDGVLTIDASSSIQLGSNDALPSEEFVQPEFIIDGEEISPNTYKTPHGTLVFTDAATGLFEYSPDKDFFGSDSFGYRVTTQRNDGPGAAALADVATVNITVNPVNDVPAAVDQSFVTLEDTTLRIVDPADPSSLGNLISGALGDAEPAFDAPPQDESNQTFQVVALSAQGNTISGPGTSTLSTTYGQLQAEFATSGHLVGLSYTPNQDLNRLDPSGVADLLRSDSFEFTIEDDGVSEATEATRETAGTKQQATATATIEVKPTNDAPLGVGETIAADDASYLAYFAGLDPAATAPVPTEDTSLSIPTAFLLSNDAVGRATAMDERSNTPASDSVGIDGDLSISNPVLLNPALGTLSISDDGTSFVFAPATDIYGDVAFTYDITDEGRDEAIDGTLSDDPLSVTVTSTIRVAPVNDVPVTFARSIVLDEVVESDTATPASVAFDAARLINGAAPETPSDEGATGIAPFNEDEQSLSVVAFEVPGQDPVDATVDEPGLTGGTGSVTRTTTSGGTLTFHFQNGQFADGTYAPAVDYSERTPFEPTDLFSFIVQDDGATTFPSGDSTSLPEERSAAATVTVTVTESNDPPLFTMPAAFSADENEGGPVVAAGFVTGIAAGPATARDELEAQTVAFDVTPVNVPAGLMDQIPTVDANGQLTIHPAADAFGIAVYTVTATDSDPAEPRSRTQRLTVTINPVNDVPLAEDRSLVIDEAVELDGETAGLIFTVDDLLIGKSGETPNAEGDFPDTLATPCNEAEQSLRVVAFQIPGQPDVDVTVDESGLSAGSGTVTRTTVTGGVLSFTFAAGEFVDGSYSPAVDYNERTPFDPVDLFSYQIADNGQSTMLGSGFVSGGADEMLDLADERSVPATMTLTVTESNDPPLFDFQSVVDILERDDDGVTVISNWATNIRPGADSALDELQRQSVSFTYLADQSTVPADLFRRAPLVLQDGRLAIFPSIDAVGTAQIVIQAEDNEDTTGFEPRTTTVTFTLNVQPVNDPPRLDPDVLGTSDGLDADTAYTVADGGAITYTLREDNTQADGGTSVDYFIPLRGLAGGEDYSQLGLLDVFTVGPPNEAGELTGGSQQLSLVNGLPALTDKGGTLEFVVVDGVAGLNYRPPTDLNGTDACLDGFTYTVIDNSVVGGETYSLADAALLEDWLTTSNRVNLSINPVNDRPQFTVPSAYVEAAEDSAPVTISRFVTNIGAGPLATATDETSGEDPQTVQFQIDPIGFTQGSAEDPFAAGYPQISPSGELTFQPRSDAFGQYQFAVTLVDSGLGLNDNDRGDLNQSLPTTITIDIQPVNDPPVLAGDAAPLEFDVVEDQSIDIPLTGDALGQALSDGFTAGPANEAADIAPELGGNQTLSLATDLPTSSSQNGTITPITDDAGNVTHLRYTPRANFVGTDTFSFRVTDDGITVDVGTGGERRLDPLTASNGVTLNVLPVNDAPILNGGGDVSSNEDQGVVTVSGWATNLQAGPDGADDENSGESPQPLEFVITQVSSTDSGLFVAPPSAIITGNSAVLTYETANDANGEAVFEVLLRDQGPTDSSNGQDVNESVVQTFTVSVAAVNDAPVFTPGPSVQIEEDSGAYSQPWATGVLPGPATATDEIESQSVRFEVTTPAQSTDLFADGALPAVISDGVLSFRPATNASGTATVLITAVDSQEKRSAPVSLQITVAEIDDSPTPVDDFVDTNEDATVTITSASILTNDVDPDLITNPNEALRVEMPAVQLSSLGARVTFDPATGIIRYDPSTSAALQVLTPDEQAEDTFQYRVLDTDGESPQPSATVRLTVSGRNDAPWVLTNDFGVSASSPTVVRPLDNDTDVDGQIDPASVVITLQPNFGSLTLEDDGTLTYTPFASFTTGDMFRYTVADNLGQQSEQAVVRLLAHPVASDVEGIGTSKNRPVSIDVTENVSTATPLDAGSIVIVSPPQHGVAEPQADGTVQYTPDQDFVGEDSFSYTIANTDGVVSNAAAIDLRVVGSPLQNPVEPSDINADGQVTAADALAIINRLNRAGNVPDVSVEPDDQGPPFYDQNGDGRISAADALRVINTINRDQSGIGEGSSIAEGEAAEQPLGGPTSSDLPSLGDGDQLRSAQVTAPSLDSGFEANDKIVGSSTIEPVSARLIDLLAEGRSESESDSDEITADAIDAVLATLL